jgi:curli biogenesis system outer membrane secretion channel CsgG
MMDMARSKRFAYALSGAALAALTFAVPAAAGESSARKAQTKSMQEIPVCQKRLGTIAVVEPDTNWWQQLGLGSPEAIIKLFVMKSGCFGLVDRGKGLASRNIERALADNGELQEGSNIGKRQVKAADYFVVPDLVAKNERSGGNALGGIVGGLLGSHTVGALAGGLSTNSKEANVMLTLVNARTTEQERMTEGYFRKRDLSWAAGGGGGWWTGFGAVGASGYSNTEIGQVIVLAYLDAYKKLVGELGGLPVDPSAAAPPAGE